MLNLHKLMIFEAVAREGSLSAAAERLYLSQSSVSQHMRELEASLGVTLFERGPGGITLTAKGHELLAMARELLRQAAEIERRMMDITRVMAGHLRLGATPGVSAYLIPGWLGRFQSQCPHIELTVHTGTTEKVTDDVYHRTTDIAITEGDPGTAGSEVRYEQLTTYEQFIVVGQAHPWWSAESLPLSALEGRCLITRQAGSHSRTWLDNVLVRNGVDVQVSAAFDGVEAIKQSVIPSERCFTVLPQYVIQGEQAAGLLRAVPVRDVQLERGLWLVQNRDMPLSPFAQAFIDSLRALLE